MEKFKEKRIVNILNICGALCVIFFMISILLALIDNIFIIGFLFIPLGAVFFIPVFILSDRDRYTKEFLAHFREKLKNVKSLEELIKMGKEFESLAIEDEHYCLSYPVSVKQLHQEIIHKIEILNAINKNGKYIRK